MCNSKIAKVKHSFLYVNANSESHSAKAACDRKRNKRLAAKKRAQRKRRLRNLFIYRFISFNAKYHIALNGYEFSDCLGDKAIVMDKIKMNADGDYSRFVRAGTAMKYQTTSLHSQDNQLQVAWSTKQITDGISEEQRIFS